MDVNKRRSHIANVDGRPCRLSMGRMLSYAPIQFISSQPSSFQLVSPIDLPVSTFATQKPIWRRERFNLFITSSEPTGLKVIDKRATSETRFPSKIAFFSRPFSERTQNGNLRKATTESGIEIDSDTDTDTDTDIDTGSTATNVNTLKRNWRLVSEGREKQK